MARNEQRIRYGAGGWVPREIGFAAWRDTFETNPVNRFKFTFRYFQPEHQKENDANHQTLEITANIPCINNKSPWGNDWFGNLHQHGYEPELWATNIPAKALPHEDNMFFESENLNPLNDFANNGCGPDGKISIGFGVGNMAELQNDTEYWVELGTYCQDYCDTNTSVDLRAQTGTMYDADVFVIPFDDANCRWKQWELDVWNHSGNDEILAKNLRWRASWCNFIDYNSSVTFVQQGTANTGSNVVEKFGLNWLYNQGMEQGSGSDITGYNWWHQYGVPVNRLQYCNWTKYDGNCWVQFNGGNGNGDVSIQQDVPYPGGGDSARFTGEAMLRCPTTNPGDHCPIAIALRGIGGPSPDEGWSMTFNIPKTGEWYRCRLDRDHPNGTSGWTGSHSTLRWEVYNQGGYGYNLDIDYTFLGPRHQEEDPRKPLPGWLDEIVGIGSVKGDVPTPCVRATGNGAPIK